MRFMFAGGSSQTVSPVSNGRLRNGYRQRFSNPTGKQVANVPPMGPGSCEETNRTFDAFITRHIG